GVDGGRDAVGGEHHDLPLGHLLGLLDEDGALGLERLDHVRVVHDLLAYVDRCAVLLQRLLDRHDGSIDSGAVAAGLGHENAAGRRGLEHHSPYATWSGRPACASLHARTLPDSPSPTRLPG